MNRIDTILKKERTNTDRIFVYVLDNRFIAFGHSAYYLALLCPLLEVTRGHSPSAGSFVCLSIPDGLMSAFSQKYSILADDECILVTPPLNIYRQRDYFAEWKEQQLHVASKIDLE